MTTSAWTKQNPPHTNGPEPSKHGNQVLQNPRWNKLTAFTHEERQALGLEGLLPPAVETIDMQVKRALAQLDQKTTDIERYIYLVQLIDSSETLFYRVVMSDPARMLPIIYAPTVGEACLKFGHIFRRPRGMYISIDQRGRVKEVLRNWPETDVRFICVTTGGRILGLGDLGANGMGIPIGKLQLYTACAGVPPEKLLPLLLDCGTDNHALLNDPLYLGLRRPRPSTAELDEFVEEFVQAVQEVFPRCCIHFEDWKGEDALRLLARYRDKICCYNDDIQGTASVTLAGLMSAMRITGEKLCDQRVLLFGAGAASIGIADMLVSAMELEGLPREEARARIWMFNSKGLLQSSRTDLSPEQRVYAHAHEATADLNAAIESLQTSILIGVSTKPRAFDQKVIETMSALNERPVIFALSNPTNHAECTAEDAYRWSKGKAIYAAGVQFPPVHLGGDLFLPSQANNFYVFPAIGLAVFATQAKRITDEMFVEAARATAAQLTPAQLAKGMLFPPQSEIFDVELATAIRVAELVFDRGLAKVARPGDMRAWIASLLYRPDYGQATHMAVR
jgi:malate dehydrogenase (oxaloacetate-decarboxylating)(NADP+)